jgi:membrane protein YdbS with pleckstrin-like domain
MTGAVRPEPTNTLPDGVRAMWLCEDAIAVLVLAGVAFGIAAAVEALMPWLPLVAAAGGLAHVVLVPRERHRRYRWELHEEELDLLAGVLSVTRTIVPITRVQHVSVERSGWTNIFNVVRLNVHTAAGKTTIPGLHPTRAGVVRDEILSRLRTPDDL